ncbi:MAG: SDR family oxidoreductase [Halioglobus sp.]
MTLKKTWLITGGSRGIGLAVAQRAIDAGDRVAIMARGESVVEAAAALGDNCMAVRCDVADRASVVSAVDTVVEQWGAISCVVNNAGIHRGGKIGRLKLDDWETVLGANLTGAMNVIAVASEHMGEGGSIVNTGAVVGFRGFPGDSAYASSKAGIAGLTRALAIELAPKAITVNLVIPGLVLTEMTSGLSEKALEAMCKTIPLGRYGESEEIAEVIEWVARSRYMTGAFVPVDGGLMSSFGIAG